MALGSLKRGREPGVPLDVRSLSTPENTPKAREKLNIRTKDLEYFLTLERDEKPMHKADFILLLISIFPDKEEEIFSSFSTNREKLLKIINDKLDINEDEYIFLHYAYILKCLNPRIVFTPRTKALIKSRLREKQKTIKNNVQVFLKYTFYYQVIFGDLELFNREEVWQAAEETLQIYKDDEAWMDCAYILGYLRVLFPEQYSDLIDDKLWAHIIGIINHNILSNVMELYKIPGLQILNADEVVIDETGLHLINHPAPESLDGNVPEQPQLKQI